MAVNYAAKYEKKIDERFKLKSLTEAGVNREYQWVGVDTINVYTIPTVPLNDYTKSGTSRYGTPTELSTTTQSMQVTKDRSFSITIDKATMQDTPLGELAGKALAMETDELIIPEIDTYRLATMGAAAIAAGGTATAASTASNAYSQLLSATEYFGDNKVPVNGRIAWVSYGYYSFIKLDSGFMLASEMSKEELTKGVVGQVDGVKIVPVPSSYLPANTSFIMAHPSATVACKKLEDYKVHDNPPGINGALIEGRVRYDSFVLNNKNTALYIHKIA